LYVASRLCATRAATILVRAALDVPPASIEIAFGILLQGVGEVWLDDVQFATIGSDVPTTGMAI